MTHNGRQSKSLDIARYKVLIGGKVRFLRAQGGILVTQGTLLLLIFFKIRSAWNNGYFGNLGNIALTDFVILRTIQNLQ